MDLNVIKIDDKRYVFEQGKEGENDAYNKIYAKKLLVSIMLMILATLGIMIGVWMIESFNLIFVPNRCRI